MDTNQPNQTSTRRTFLRKTALGVLTLTVLDLSPALGAEEQPRVCGQGIGDIDQTCGVQASRDENCNNGQGSQPRDPDANCTRYTDRDESCTPGIDDKDESCSTGESDPQHDKDERCGTINNKWEKDEACSGESNNGYYDADESCKSPIGAVGPREDNRDEACGGGSIGNDQDNFCSLPGAQGQPGEPDEACSTTVGGSRDIDQSCGMNAEGDEACERLVDRDQNCGVNNDQDQACTLASQGVAFDHDENCRSGAVDQNN